MRENPDFFYSQKWFVPNKKSARLPDFHQAMVKRLVWATLVLNLFVNPGCLTILLLIGAQTKIAAEYRFIV